MKDRIFFILLIILLILPVGSVAVDIPENLQIITENYPPLNYEENDSLKGISVDLVEAVLLKMESNLNRSSFQLMSWDEGYNLTLHTPNSMLFSTSRTPERENLFLWAGPIISDRKVLFMHTNSDVQDEDISNLRIVVIKNDSGAGYASKAGADAEKFIEVSSGDEAVRMIEEKNADAWAYGEIAGRKFIEEDAKDPSVFVIGKELGIIEDYIVFNQETSLEFVQEVNETIQDLKLDRSRNGITSYEQILARYLSVECVNNSITREQVTDLVSLTSADIASDASGTIAAINTGKSPYRNIDNSDLYVFVFDTKVNLLANAVNTMNNGKNLSGTTDVSGKPFRDLMISGAVENGEGWIEYTYSNPDSLGLFTKMSYYQLVTGSDGNEYVVGAGRYMTCNEQAEINSEIE